MKKKLTIQDIANEANVSKTTVSFYLNNKYEKMSKETRERIEEVIRKHDYRPNINAQSLKSKKSKIIGVIVSDITINFSNLLVKGADEVLEKLGYQIIVGNSNFNFEREKNYIDRMLDMGVDGMIVQASNEFINNRKTLINNQCPIIYVDSVNPEIQENDVYIKTKDAEVIQLAFDKLMQNSYDKYIFVTEDIEFLTVRKHRLNGFLNVVENQGLNYEVITFDNLDKFTKDLEKSIYKKTLIFCSNGRVTQFAFNTLKTLKLDIPKDVGLIGFDTWNWTQYSTPKVTTINQPNFLEGQIAAENIVSLINGETVTNTQIMAEIRWEESTN